MEVTVSKDKKGSSFMVSHVRCGYHECIWLTIDELRELKEKIEAIL